MRVLTESKARLAPLGVAPERAGQLARAVARNSPPITLRHTAGTASQLPALALYHPRLHMTHFFVARASMAAVSASSM